MTRPACTCAARACRPCALVAARDDYARLWGVDETERAAVRERVERLGGWAASPGGMPSLPCVHLGDLLTDDQKADRDLYQLRDYRWCLNTTRPLGEAVCSCAGCGLRCAGYEAEGDVDR